MNANYANLFYRDDCDVFVLYYIRTITKSEQMKKSITKREVNYLRHDIASQIIHHRLSWSMKVKEQKQAAEVKDKQKSS